MRVSWLGMLFAIAAWVGCGGSDPAEGQAKASRSPIPYRLRWITWGPLPQEKSRPKRLPTWLRCCRRCSSFMPPKIATRPSCRSWCRRDFWHVFRRRLLDKSCVIIQPMGRCGGWHGRPRRLRGSLQGWLAGLSSVFDPIEARRSAVGLKPLPDGGLEIVSQNDSVGRDGMAWPILLQGEERAMLRPVTSDQRGSCERRRSPQDRSGSKPFLLKRGPSRGFEIDQHRTV